MDATATAARRLQTTLLHIAPPELEGAHSTTALLGAAEFDEARAHSAAAVTSVNVRALQAVLDGAQVATRDALRQLLTSEPFFALRSDLEPAAYREQVLRWAVRLAQSGITGLSDLRDDPQKFFAFFETLSFHDHSLCIKFAVQWNLWGASVLFIGTERHHRLLPAISRFELPGVFGLTELGHGTNVQGITTTAIYDSATREFIINSPDQAAEKYWPGNIAKHGTTAVIFARLLHDGGDLGVHAFIVPFRDSATMDPLPGVRIRDIGKKIGHNGIDNGGLKFDSVRIPRENMLDRFAEMSAEGRHRFKDGLNARRYFAVTLAPLVAGRIVILALSIGGLKVGVATAVRYSARRLQFGPGGDAGGGERPLLTYATQQRRLLPALARAYVFHFAVEHLKQRFAARGASWQETHELHIAVSGLKAVGSWAAVYGLQLCRESMGGQGYRAANRVGPLRDDVDMYTTGEGDNNAMLQQVARALLAQHKARPVQPTPPPPAAAAGGSQLLDRKWLAAALLFREHSRVKQLAERLAALEKGGMPAYDAWSLCLVAAMRAAEAHVERLCVAIYDAAVATVADAALRQTLIKLGDLDAVTRFRDDLDWFLAAGVIPLPAADSVDDLLLCCMAQLAPIAVQLVDAFGIPEPLLPAIANGYD